MGAASSVEWWACGGHPSISNQREEKRRNEGYVADRRSGNANSYIYIYE